ncbi:MAG: dTDP-4-dehydrorhamnose 3,5-epimerase [Acidobacteria bacterium]|nr:MAG: dTDP-4-dehydrorhamnose 3,5-epimerase [Acidobacteriota bacterium]
MNIAETKLRDAYVVEPLRFDDERGFFARSWSLKDLHGWEAVSMVESNVSYNARAGTLRGMHYQCAPHQQAKVVRCTRGSVYDVIVDLRADSPTFKEWVAAELSSENRLTLCVPAGFAHGPAAQRGVRWNDPAFRIEWPRAQERVMADRDRDYPDFKL